MICVYKYTVSESNKVKECENLVASKNPYFLCESHLSCEDAINQASTHPLYNIEPKQLLYNYINDLKDLDCY